MEGQKGVEELMTYNLRNKNGIIVGCKTVCIILHEAGFEGYLVGGAVRDFVIGTTSHDVDIATNATPDEVSKLFQSKGWKVVPVGEKYGTVQVGSAYTLPIEITTYRSEGKYSDKRHPDNVKFEKDLIKDLERRDFTINAMALDPLTLGYWDAERYISKIIDPFSGRKDIKNMLIKAVGDPETRFEEDPLRMMRMCRFSGKLGFTLEKRTLEASKKLHALIYKIPAERVRDELLKILQVENFGYSWSYLRQSKLLDSILPEVTALKKVNQPKVYHKYNAFTHTFMTVLSIPREKPLLRLAAMLHDIGKIMRSMTPPPYFPDHISCGLKLLDNIVFRLRLSNEEEDYIRFMVQHHMDIFNLLPHTSKRSMRRYLVTIGDKIKWLDDLFLLIKADIKATGYDKREWIVEVNFYRDLLDRTLNEKPPLTKNDLAINGHDLMALGITPSPLLGKIQDELLYEVVGNPELNTRKYLLKRARELMKDA